MEDVVDSIGQISILSDNLQDLISNLETKYLLLGTSEMEQDYKLIGRSIKYYYDHDSLNAFLQSSLTNLADNCPYEGGDAVFIARGLLEINNGYIDYDDEDICRIAEGRSRPLRSNPPLTIMPNPGTGQYTIIHENDGDQLIVYNLMGNVIDKYDGFEKIKHIDISHIPQGLYKVVLLNALGDIISSKTLIHVR